MKNYFILAAISLIIFSCKKDRVCSCTITKTGTSTTTGKAELVIIPGFPLDLADTSFVTNINETQSVDKKIEKVTKRRAKNNCISYTEPYNETILTSVPASSFNLSVIVTNKGDKHYACELK
ncbi:MAG: hypothetical protein Q7W45_13335 [Bacteroidota bacterium]|nr:hypothetical protein [Bacteroidota bacterium]MDP3144496.1 hypothetical protein [Bacteroidota bacterium]MDP3555823.1 hypothetical protein [Bacteroidota bacterium]